MAFAFIASTAAGSGANTVTTSAIDTTGADLLVAFISQYPANPDATLTDNKGNTWTPLTTQQSSGTGAKIRPYYSIPSSVGAGHTFTAAGSASFPGIAVMAFSGAKPTDQPDQQNGAASESTSGLNTGSITPGEDNELIIAGDAFDGDGGAVSIDSGMTLASQVAWSSGNHDGVACAYKIQTSAAAINPKFTQSVSCKSAVAVISFKSGVAPGTTIDVTKILAGGVAAVASAALSATKVLAATVISEICNISDPFTCSISVQSEQPEAERCGTTQVLFLSGSFDGMVNRQDINSHIDNGNAISSVYQTGYYEQPGVMQLGAVGCVARGQGSLRVAVLKSQDEKFDLHRPIPLKDALKSKVIKTSKSSPYWSLEFSNGSNPGDWFELSEAFMFVRQIFKTRRPEEPEEDVDQGNP